MARPTELRHPKPIPPSRVDGRMVARAFALLLLPLAACASVASAPPPPLPDPPLRAPEPRRASPRIASPDDGNPTIQGPPESPVAGSITPSVDPHAPKGSRPATPRRVVPIVTGCSGPALVLDATFSSCACDERDDYILADGSLVVRAGSSCGARHPEELGPPPRVTVSLSSNRVAPNETVTLAVVLANDTAASRRYRAIPRVASARFVRPSGEPIPTNMGSSTSGTYAEEALFELPPAGTATITLEATASISRYEGKRAVTVGLPPGAYAIEVDLGSLGGKKLLPVDVR